MKYYIGDVVYTASNKKCIVRLIDGHRLLLQVGEYTTWVSDESVFWKGEALSRLPMTRRGWRKLGRKALA